MNYRGFGSPSVAGQELTRMFRRLMSIVLLCASLLGLAQPLMACAADRATTDCCTGGSTSGCTTDTAPMLVAAGGSCCAVTPAGATSSIVAPSRSVDSPLPVGGTPDSLCGARVTDSASPTAFSLNLRAAEAARATHATLTYLHTARLRL